MALGVFKKAWNTTQLADLTDYFSSILATYLLKLNSNNTASGISTATINGRSGIVEYTQPINVSDFYVFQFTNSSISASSVLSFSIKYDGLGIPFVLSYEITGTTVSVTIGNFDSLNPTNSPIFLNFVIIN
jgi:hypothetical protein